jgi:hypothetical protein
MIVAAFLLGAIAIPAIGIWIFSPHTEYSEGFSEEAWGKLKVGMSESEVRSIIGEPLSEFQWTTDQEKTTLSYSRPPSFTDSYVNYYVVIEDSKVLRKGRYVVTD